LTKQGVALLLLVDLQQWFMT